MVKRASKVLQPVQGDCLKGMEAMAPKSVDMVFCDPPFNIGESYDIYQDRKSYDDYMSWSQLWMSEVFRILKPGGAFWLCIGDEFAADLKVLACRSVGFNLRSWVVWYYTFGVNSSQKLTRSHCHLLYFLKGKQANVFNKEAVKVPSSRQLVYNDKRAKDGGRLPDDTWILRPQWLPDAFCSGEDTWQVSRVCGTFKERQGTPNQLPEPILARIINLCSNPDDLVFDPMAGSGTTLAVAKKLGRQFAGFELSPEYAERAQARVEAAKLGQALAGAVPQGELQTTEVA